MSEIPNTLSEEQINSIVGGKESLDKPDVEIQERDEVLKDVEEIREANENLKAALQLIEASKRGKISDEELKEIFTE